MDAVASLPRFHRAFSGAIRPLVYESPVPVTVQIEECTEISLTARLELAVAAGVTEPPTLTGSGIGVVCVFLPELKTLPAAVRISDFWQKQLKRPI